MDIKELDEMVKGLKDYYSQMHANFAKYLDAFHGKWSIQTPEGFEPHIPPTARTKIETLAGALTPENLMVKVPVMRTKRDVKKAQEQAQKIKEFLQDVLMKVDRCNGYSIIQETLTDVLLYGITAVKGVFYDPDAWGDKPKRRDGESNDDFEDRVDEWESGKFVTFPLRVMVVDPQNLYPDPDLFNGYPPNYVIEIYERKVGQVLRDFPNLDVPAKMNKFDDIEVTEYWDAERRVVAARNEILLDSPHFYGYVPYLFAFAGLGKGSPKGKPEERAIGLMALMYSSVYSEILDRTALDITNQFAGIPTLRSTPDLPGDIQITPGSILRLNPNIPITPLLPSNVGVGKGIYDSLAITRSDIEETTYGSVLSGMSVSGVESGVHQQMLATQSRRRYATLLTDLERMWAMIGTRALQVVERLVLEPVNEYLEPRDIKGHYACQVKFNLSDEAYRRAMVTEARSLRGILSDKTIREAKLNIPNSDAEEAQLILEQILRNPAVLNVLAQKALMQSERETEMIPGGGEAVEGTPPGMGGQMLKGLAAKMGQPAGATAPRTTERYGAASPMGGRVAVEGEL